MGILRRSTSMVSPEAWEELDKQARLVFQAALSARKFVDFVGPKGWNYTAHSLGRLYVDPQQSGAIRYGINMLLPLVEVRQSFLLDIWELDDIVRGCRNPNLTPLEDAAHAVAEFEEKIIYEGFEPAGIAGLSGASADNTVNLKYDLDSLDFEPFFLRGLTAALGKLRDSAVQGPYTLVACPSLWNEIYTRGDYAPFSDKVKNVTGGDIVRSNRESASYLISGRGGDFELVVGQDLSLGYDGREGTNVKFFFAESFTFNVVNSEAVIPLVFQPNETEEKEA
ncbi:MAG: bacteriocin family protein [Synergistaceae bacterium]|jgi:uncharacterized linocin/CFP29 family protein|nr:bacteriocin family protein [Synergistaceae bacterium]